MTGPISFGPFQVDLARGILLRDGQSVTLGQRGIALLSALVAAQGKAVAKADLMEAGWPGLAVEEGNLTVQIAGLRKALGPGPGGAEWIVTVPRVGYRLVVADGPDALPKVSDLPLIAVLPFSNISGGVGQDYFADGVVEDIAAALSRFRSFAVIPRNATLTYKGSATDARQVAAELRVRYLLQGSVRRADDRLRIVAQLVDGTSAAQLWAATFDGDATDVFAFQDHIAANVVAVVEPKVQAAELDRVRRKRPASPVAYDLYLQAMAQIQSETEAGSREAFALLNGASALEPENAQYLAGAVYVLEHRINVGWPPLGPDDRQACADLVHRALQHAQGDPQVMAYCAMSLLTARDYDRGMALITSAAAANPNSVSVLIRAGIGALHCGSLDEAMALCLRVIALSQSDPARHIPLCAVGHIHLIRGNHAVALDWANQSLALNPSFDPAHWMVIAANAHLGRMAQAQAALQQFRHLTPGATVSGIRAGQPAKDPSRLAAILDGLRLAGLPEA